MKTGEDGVDCNWGVTKEVEMMSVHLNQNEIRLRNQTKINCKWCSGILYTLGERNDLA